MKKLTILLALIFTVMFSSTSFSEWKKVAVNVTGSTFYVDFERIRKHGGYVYWWELFDFLKPDEDGDLSQKSYRQGECKLYRYKFLSGSYHKQPMGGGNSSGPTPPDKWRYPAPDTPGEFVLKTVCAYAK